MTSIQRQAQALGEPTRYAIYTAIAEAVGPLGVAELADRMGLHPNAIRQHLARLVEAGLIVESTATPSGRGRPRLLYAPDPNGRDRWGHDGPYEELSRLLAEVVATGDRPDEVGRRAAARLRATDPGPAPSGDAVDDVTRAMARQGFDPVTRRDGDRAEVVLRSCPFESAATTAREAVCTLHLGLADGLVAGTGVTVDELVAHDPTTAGCRLRLEVDDPDAPGGPDAHSARGGSDAHVDADRRAATPRRLTLRRLPARPR
ncbi:MAG: helix-turn-helix domain-containing protein [Acidimicrobiales bacterium]|nr:helix-turn-helix domain-containing protein [Acidimicrobiales bacterium]